MTVINKIRKFIVEGKLLEKVYQKIKQCFFNCFNGTYRKKVFMKFDRIMANRARRKVALSTKIKNNQIFFTTFSGSYNCNPKAIVEEILRQKLPWELVWVGKDNDLKKMEQFPSALKVVLWESYEFYKEAAASKVWITNSTYLTSLNLYKKPEQILIQTWHGSLGLKRFETNQNKKWIKTGIQDGSRTDYCISNSSFEDSLFKNTFWGNAQIWTLGHARNDILLTKDSARISAIKEKIRLIFKIPKDVKIALYAPTFRDSKSLTPYSIDYEILREGLHSRFGGKWVILCRLHFQVRAALRKAKIQYPEFVINATDYEDIQDLLTITDVGITDYSSWICDYVLTRRPAFIFATDLRSYYDERGFYYPLESTPFPIAQNNQELYSNILSFDEESYRQKCDAFIADKGCIDDGHAAERIVEKLKEIMEDKAT